MESSQLSPTLQEPGAGLRTHLVLVRHGQTEWNAADRLQGRTDIPLNDAGREQAREAGRRLAAEPWDVLVSSPLGRAVETARLIGEEIGLAPAAVVKDLVERDYGHAEGHPMGGLTEPEVTAMVGAGESAESVAERGLSALRALVQEYPGKRIVAVAHGTLIRLTLSALNGTPHPRVPNCEAVPVDLELLGPVEPVA